MTAPSLQGERLGIDKPGSRDKPRGAGSVMSTRTEAPDSLDDFPTPPWATRALCEAVLPRLGVSLVEAKVWEPACGRGLMSEVLREYAASVFASDVHDYGRTGRQETVGSFVGAGLDVLAVPGGHVDAIITNPPFRLAVDFFERAIADAEIVALLVRSNWAEGIDRYERIFSKHPPLCDAQFVERVPMVRGRWDPDASTATAYSWFVWLRGSTVETRRIWIPPGQRQRLTKPDDVARFAAPSAYKSEAA